MRNEKDELVALHDLVGEVSRLMKKRLLEKYYAGYRGWDNPELRDQLKARALDKILKGEFIDAINFCAMCYNIDMILKEQDNV
jgi:hypothetical protein